MRSMDEASLIVPELVARMARGAASVDVARWLYLGPAGQQPMVATAALALAGVGLGDAKGLVMAVIRDVDEVQYDAQVALQTEASKLTCTSGASSAGRT